MRNILAQISKFAALVLSVGALASCTTFPESGGGMTPALNQAMPMGDDSEFGSQVTSDYLIGPYDQLQIFVWRAEELSIDVTVRPDGRISTPLVEDMIAAGKTPSRLSRDLEVALAEYVKSPEVTVIVGQFSSTFEQQVRVLGEAAQPSAIPYQAGMTVLDVMLSVGGLTDYAAGNRAKLIRGRGADEQTYRVRLDDLMRRGDVTANAPVRPGDVILIPESRF